MPNIAGLVLSGAIWCSASSAVPCVKNGGCSKRRRRFRRSWGEKIQWHRPVLQSQFRYRSCLSLLSCLVPWFLVQEFKEMWFPAFLLPSGISHEHHHMMDWSSKWWQLELVRLTVSDHNAWQELKSYITIIALTPQLHFILGSGFWVAEIVIFQP